MSSPERRRLNRLERRCDWLEARIAIGESKGRNMSFDVAELSALRWVIDSFAAGLVDLAAENQRLRTRIAHQRLAIRKLAAQKQGIVHSDDALDAIVDAAVEGQAGARLDE